MAYTTINKSTDYFNTVTYTGNGSTQNITGVGFQPDLVWAKRRSADGWHFWTDAVRGAGKAIYSNNTDAEFTDTDNSDINSFLTDGFSVGNNADVNGNGQTHVGWNWLGANGTASNTDGSITSTVSANTTSGFSIVKWTGTGSSVTIGHGLGVAPKVVIVKRYTSTSDWVYYTSTIDGSMDYLYLNLTNAKVDSGNPVPTSSVFQKSDTNGETQIAYCFADVTGYSKFGSYTGAGSNLPFIYTGFKPAFVLIKRSDGTPNWTINDTARDPTNVNNLRLFPNQNVVESSGSDSMDMLSNGFKLRSTDGGNNASGGTYIYMAFAEAPLVGSNNVPCTAR